VAWLGPVGTIGPGVRSAQILLDDWRSMDDAECSSENNYGHLSVLESLKKLTDDHSQALERMEATVHGMERKLEVVQDRCELIEREVLGLSREGFRAHRGHRLRLSLAGTSKKARAGRGLEAVTERVHKIATSLDTVAGCVMEMEGQLRKPPLASPGASTASVVAAGPCQDPAHHLEDDLELSDLSVISERLAQYSGKAVDSQPQSPESDQWSSGAAGGFICVPSVPSKKGDACQITCGKALDQCRSTVSPASSARSVGESWLASTASTCEDYDTISPCTSGIIEVIVERVEERIAAHLFSKLEGLKAFASLRASASSSEADSMAYAVTSPEASIEGSLQTPLCSSRSRSNILREELPPSTNPKKGVFREVRIRSPGGSPPSPVASEPHRRSLQVQQQRRPPSPPPSLPSTPVPAARNIRVRPLAVRKPFQEPTIGSI